MADKSVNWIRFKGRIFCDLQSLIDAFKDKAPADDMIMEFLDSMQLRLIKAAYAKDYEDAKD